MKTAKSRDSDVSLDDRALQILERNSATSVRALYELLRVEIPSLSESELADTLWRLADQGKAKLEDIPLEASFGQYLLLWERNLWLYGTLIISFAAIFTVYAVPVQFPFVVLRWVLGSIFVLFIPGFATVEALFPRGSELNSIERFALSIGLSLALTMFTGVLVNYTPWGISLTPILIALSLLTVGVTMIALARQFLLAVQNPKSSTTHLPHL